MTEPLKQDSCPNVRDTGQIKTKHTFLNINNNTEVVLVCAAHLYP